MARILGRVTIGVLLLFAPELINASIVDAGFSLWRIRHQNPEERDHDLGTKDGGQVSESSRRGPLPLSPNAEELNCIAHSLSGAHLDQADQTPHLLTDTVTLLLTENDPGVLFARRHTRCVKGHEVANVEGIQRSSMQTRVFKML
jgi:hypothetical protein